MKLLQKILFVAIVGIVGWDTDVRGLQFADPRHAGGGANPNIVAVGVGGALAGLAAGVVEPNFGDNYVGFDINAADRIYFPETGIQPHANLVGRLARANDVNVAVTNWYIEAFGGAKGLAASVNAGVAAPAAINIPQMGFKNNTPSLVITHTPRKCERLHCKNPEMTRFWRAFRSIAENPVGRVLLYRILIEIRRQNAGNGACGDGIVPGNRTMMRRNLCRSIIILYNIQKGSFFSCATARTLAFDPEDLKSITVRIGNLLGAGQQLDTNQDPIHDSIDIGIFHEMLHWFHYLRHPKRYIDSDDASPTVYRYLLRSYYGDHQGISELYTWGNSIDDEEFRTILGTPNYNEANHFALLDFNGTFLPGPGVINMNVGGNMKHIPYSDRFLEGDDLSENVYRMARDRGPAAGGRHKMRFGHGDKINPITLHGHQLPKRFQLAHLVATDCYNAITGE